MDYRKGIEALIYGLLVALCLVIAVLLLLAPPHMTAVHVIYQGF
jgi:hypothetical protein